MASALRRLGVFLFCFGAIAVVAGLVPVSLALASEKREQTWLAVAMIGGLLVVCGLVMDFLGSQAVRDQQVQQQASTGVPVAGQYEDPRPPTMRLSSAPKGAKGYREDLMA
jgi:hypothetical protein